MISAVQTGFYNFATWSFSKVSEYQEKISTFANDLLAKQYLLLYGSSSHSENAYGCCRDLCDDSIEQICTPNKSKIWKLFGAPKEKTIPYFKDGIHFQFTIQILSCCLNKNYPTHTCLRFGGAKENKDILIAQGISLLSSYTDFVMNHDNKESCYNLTLLQANFYDVLVKKMGDSAFRQWKPNSAEGFGDLSYLIEALSREEGTQIDSFYFYSLGTTVFYGLKEPSIAAHLSGTTIVIDRGFTRSDSVAMKVFKWPLAMLLRGISHGLGWAVNTEEAMIEALKQVPPHKPRTFIVEVEDDHFFSGEAAFNPNLTDVLSPFVTSVDRIMLRSEPVNEELQAVFGSNTNSHGVPTNYLYPLERIRGIYMTNNTIHFKPDENLAQFMVRSVFCLTKEH